MPAPALGGSRITVAPVRSNPCLICSFKNPSTGAATALCLERSTKFADASLVATLEDSTVVMLSFLPYLVARAPENSPTPPYRSRLFASISRPSDSSTISEASSSAAPLCTCQNPPLEIRKLLPSARSVKRLSPLTFLSMNHWIPPVEAVEISIRFTSCQFFR